MLQRIGRETARERTTGAQEGRESQGQGTGCDLPIEISSSEKETFLPSWALRLPDKAVPRIIEKPSPSPLLPVVVVVTTLIGVLVWII